MWKKLSISILIGSLDFVYTQDDVMVNNKIFEASIKCTFKNFVQTEIFHIYALS